MFFKIGMATVFIMKKFLPFPQRGGQTSFPRDKDLMAPDFFGKKPAPLFFGANRIFAVSFFDPPQLTFLGVGHERQDFAP